MTKHKRLAVALMVTTTICVLDRLTENVLATEMGSGALTPDNIKEHRKAAAHRKRRIIFDNDGNEPIFCAKEATPKALLDCRTTALGATQVDTIVYCTRSSGFGLFTHNTKVGEIFTYNKNKRYKNNITGEFIARGLDPLEIMVDFCRNNGIEVFWSMRMNDTHDGQGHPHSLINFPQLKKDHPEYLLGSEENKPRVGLWTAVDYGRQGIRDLAFQYIEEVCENYEVDGIMLDFFRHLSYFKRTAKGQDAGQEELDMMTGLLRRIRQMADKVGFKRGRPILIAVRVPDSVGYCRALGFDIVRWMEEDLIDIMVVSGYFRLNPWKVSVELGHKYSVPVYPCLSESRIRDVQARKVRDSLACYRARAMNIIKLSGADGVYIFNIIDPHNPLWREIGELNTLGPLDKVYCTGARGVRNMHNWLVGANRFLNRSPVSPERPRKLDPGKPVTVKLHVGEDMQTNKKQGLSPEIKLQLRFKALPNATDVSVKLNSTPLGDGTQSNAWVEYALEPDLVLQGVNEFEIVLAPYVSATPVLEDLLLWVRYPKSPGSPDGDD